MDFDKLKVKNSKLEICGKEFDKITTRNPKIIQKYTNNHPSDYLVYENETDFENLKVKDSKLEICGKGLWQYYNSKP